MTGRSALGADPQLCLRQRTAGKVDSLAPIIAELQAAGITSAMGLAKALTERGVPTARGGSAWSTVQV